jgi:heme oxygenase
MHTPAADPTLASAVATPIMDRLRGETRHAHERTEAVPFSATMLSGRLPVERFVGQLAAYLPIHSTLEAALATSTHRAVRSVWSADLAKAPLLVRDLEAFSARGVRPEISGLAASAGFTARIVEQSAACPVALLGMLYVLEGSTLGAAVLRGHLEAAYGAAHGVSAEQGLAYYSPYGASPMPHWKLFKESMNAAIVDPREQAMAIDGANEAFARIGEILAALSAGLA